MPEISELASVAVLSKRLATIRISVPRGVYVSGAPLLRDAQSGIGDLKASVSRPVNTRSYPDIPTVLRIDHA